MPIDLNATRNTQSSSNATLAHGKECALRLHAVSIGFGALVILTDIDLTVNIGERRAVLGVNGAGKTTLLNVINGDLVPNNGQVYFFEENITAYPPYRRARRGLRRTYQISLLFHGLSVLDNIFLASRGINHGRYSLLRPAHNDFAMEEARHILGIVRLESIQHTRVSELSHGQQRQLEIGMALVNNPRFILFDEPAAGLSPNERDILVEILSNMPSTLGYLLVEHDLEIALNVVDRVTMIHNGKIFKEGTPKEIEKDRDVQELYLGSTQ